MKVDGRPTATNGEYHYELKPVTLQPILSSCARGVEHKYFQASPPLTATNMWMQWENANGGGTERLDFQTPPGSDPDPFDLSFLALVISTRRPSFTWSQLYIPGTHTSADGSVSTETWFFGWGYVQARVTRVSPLRIELNGQYSGSQDTVTVAGVFEAGGGSQGQVRSIAANPPAARVGQAVTVTAQTTPANLGVEWLGDLGSNPNRQKNVLVTRYTAPGTYRVRARLGASEKLVDIKVGDGPALVVSPPSRQFQLARGASVTSSLLLKKMSDSTIGISASAAGPFVFYPLQGAGGTGQGGNPLNAGTLGPRGSQGLNFTVGPAPSTPGTYHYTVTIQGPNVVQVPVTLVVPAVGR